MEVILLKDIEELGREGQAVNVADGYGRNYLIPRKLAVPSSPDALKILEMRKKKKLAEEGKLKSKAEELSKKIEALSTTIAVESGVDDKIFGTVTQEMIRGALLQEGLDIDKKQIIIEEPVKKLGVYQVNIKLHPEVTSSLRIWVVKK